MIKWRKVAESTGIPLGRIELLTGKNYHVWALKVAAILRTRKLFREIIESEEPPIDQNPESQAAKVRNLWETKNDEAFGVIITTLSDSQADQFLVEDKARKVWETLRQMYAGDAEDKR